MIHWKQLGKNARIEVVINNTSYTVSSKQMAHFSFVVECPQRHNTLARFPGFLKKGKEKYANSLMQGHITFHEHSDPSNAMYIN